jgi:7-cyano-7-deazaguanine synthase
MSPPRHAIVLLSGGVDSAVALAIARADGFRCAALTIDYGQRHRTELEAARAVAAAAGVRDHVFCHVDLRVFGGSALTADIDVPKDRDLHASGIPVTYVPARNTIFLSYALALAEVRAAQDVFIGVNAVDYSGYPDCRPAFVAAFERLANLATPAGIQGRPMRIHAPLIEWTKTQIIRRGLDLGVDFSLTRSCYDPDAGGRACGRCDSCRLRRAAFQALGAPDPTPYVSIPSAAL